MALRSRPNAEHNSRNDHVTILHDSCLLSQLFDNNIDCDRIRGSWHATWTEQDNITKTYCMMGKAPNSRGSKRTHFCFTGTFVKAAFMTPATRSHSLRDNAAVTARRILGCTLTSSCPRRRRARVIHTPCASTSSTISCNTRSSSAISNDRGSREAGGRWFRGLQSHSRRLRRRTQVDGMISEPACEVE